MKTAKIRFITFLTLAASLFFSESVVVKAQDQQTEKKVVDTSAESFERDNSFPVFTLDVKGGYISLYSSKGPSVNHYGINGKMSLNINAEEFQLYIEGTAGYLKSKNYKGSLFEITGRGHLLFVGINDFTYRRIGNNEHLRLLFGFGTNHQWNDVAQLSLHFGGVWWDDNITPEDEYGVQASLGLVLKLWRIENRLNVSVYQNFEVSTENFNVNGDVQCNKLTFECDLNIDGRQSFEDAVNLGAAGVLLTNKLFFNAAEGDWGTVGPEIEFRFEKLPSGNMNFWLMGSIKYSFRR